jgi:hypothetical protein
MIEKPGRQVKGRYLMNQDPEQMYPTFEDYERGVKLGSSPSPETPAEKTGR